MRRIYSDACAQWSYHNQDDDQLRTASMRDPNRDELQLHLHSGRLFSHGVQMDSQIGCIANETAENTKHV